MGILAYTGACSLHKSDTLAAGPYDIYFNEYWGKAADRCEVIIYWSKEGVNGSAFARPPPTGLSEHGELTCTSGLDPLRGTSLEVIEQDPLRGTSLEVIELDPRWGTSLEVKELDPRWGTSLEAKELDPIRGTSLESSAQRRVELSSKSLKPASKSKGKSWKPESTSESKSRKPDSTSESEARRPGSTPTSESNEPEGAVGKQELESRVDELEGEAHEKALVGMGTHDERVLNAKVDELVLPKGFNGRPLVGAADERELEASANELVSDATVNELALQGINDSTVTEKAGGSGDAYLDCRPADGILVWGAGIHLMRARDRDCTGGCNGSISVQICGHGGLWYENKKAFSMTPHARPQRAWPPASNGSPPRQRGKRMESGRERFDSMFEKLSGLVLRGRFRCEDDGLRRW
ncbi:hypothetical protein DFP72DRAFT_841563 [Ephemerocybe angulata]|uniref:Uncharacterized protein n=1 Tax=Ephemerocybe angulata TaxID=980116 RepID=A0A8H6MES3_9AGAR|nr:hypothetical protein DFP72DRAFT_841563 [Tulosesus angulatus]